MHGEDRVLEDDFYILMNKNGFYINYVMWRGNIIDNKKF